MEQLLIPGRTKVIIKVPATTANLGPAVDSLALALEIFNEVTFERSDEFSIEIEGEGKDKLSRGKDNLIYCAFENLFDYIHESVPCVKISCNNTIPVGRGLGSSAAAIISGLLGANTFCGRHLSEKEFLKVALTLEGHPDNLTAALAGGCTLTIREGDEVLYRQVPVPPRLRAIIFIPDFEMPTLKTRKLLSKDYTLEQTIFNVSRAAYLILSLTTIQLEDLRIATQDAMFQPRRKELFPEMNDIFEAALAAGALGVFLSGGGSSIIALADSNETKIIKAMTDKATQLKIQARIKVAYPSCQGAQVILSS